MGTKTKKIIVKLFCYSQVTNTTLPSVNHFSPIRSFGKMIWCLIICSWFFSQKNYFRLKIKNIKYYLQYCFRESVWIKVSMKNFMTNVFRYWVQLRQRWPRLRQTSFSHRSLRIILVAKSYVVFVIYRPLIVVWVNKLSNNWMYDTFAWDLHLNTPFNRFPSQSQL